MKKNRTPQWSQKISITVALSINADLYLIDEPTAFLDIENFC